MMPSNMLVDPKACTPPCNGTMEQPELWRETLSDDDIVGMVQMFKALADPNRIKIACVLLQTQECCVCDIASVLNSSVATASHHLRQLKLMNIAKSRKDGKKVYYSLKDHHIETMISMTLEHQKERHEHE